MESLDCECRILDGVWQAVAGCLTLRVILAPFFFLSLLLSQLSVQSANFSFFPARGPQNGSLEEKLQRTVKVY